MQFIADTVEFHYGRKRQRTGNDRRMRDCAASFHRKAQNLGAIQLYRVRWRQIMRHDDHRLIKHRVLHQFTTQMPHHALGDILDI